MTDSAVDMLANPLRNASPNAVDSELIPATIQLNELRLDGLKTDVAVGAGITGAVVEQTIEGANTLTLNVHDPGGVILTDGLLTPMNGAIEADIAGFTFVFVSLSRAGDDLTLTFEDLVVNRLRRRTGSRKVLRTKMTRAQFCQSLVKEKKLGTPKIKFYAPDRLVKQKIKKPKSSKRKRQDKDAGFAPGENLSVNGKRWSPTQKKNIERVLDVGVSVGASDKVLKSAVVALIGDTRAINKIGDDVNGRGVFLQSTKRGWPASRNIERDAEAFFTKAMNTYQANPSISTSDLTQKVQVQPLGEKYKQHVTEADQIVRSYKKGRSAAASKKRGKDVYVFSRGLPQGQRGENTWTAIQRMAEEVEWRCWAAKDTVYFVSEKKLFQSQSRITISEGADYMLSTIDFDIDSGKKVHEASFKVIAQKWGIPPGAMINLEGVGPANGKWLVSSVTNDLFDIGVSITVKRANRSKTVGVEPEPVYEESPKGKGKGKRPGSKGRK